MVRRRVVQGALVLAPPLQPTSLLSPAPTNRPLAVAMQQAAPLCSVQQQLAALQEPIGGAPGAAPPLLSAFLSLSSIFFQPPPSPCSLQPKFTECFPLIHRAEGGLAQTKEVPLNSRGKSKVSSAGFQEGETHGQLFVLPCLPIALGLWLGAICVGKCFSTL